ncbi:twin-arginine translocation signal domain-containing protein [Streptosporangium sandarakinum]|uniref:twin-arginine translocation signal domain-containing protein n=1 Tax=Streptosporangium sandarakinum TaxID=1260955 RepID=UPI0034359744
MRQQLTRNRRSSVRFLSRRDLLRDTAVGAAAATVGGCAAEEPEHQRAEPPDPQTVLLKQLIADKERIIGLYASAPSAKLLPFRRRHEAHLAELRRRLPPAARGAGASATPGPSGGAAPSAPSASGTPAPQPRASLRSLRAAERKAADSRPRQAEGASPALAQLVASIGACEAAHAVALARPL